MNDYNPIVSHTALANALAADGPFPVTILPETTTSLSTYFAPLSLSFLMRLSSRKTVASTLLSIPDSARTAGVPHIAQM
jgi:uncharacterized membrane protein YcfT